MPLWADWQQAEYCEGGWRVKVSTQLKVHLSQPTSQYQQPRLPTSLLPKVIDEPARYIKGKEIDIPQAVPLFWSINCSDSLDLSRVVWTETKCWTHVCLCVWIELLYQMEEKNISQVSLPYPSIENLIPEGKSVFIVCLIKFSGGS